MNNTLLKYISLFLLISTWTFGCVLLMFAGVFIQSMAEKYLFVEEPLNGYVEVLDNIVNPDNYYLYQHNYEMQGKVIKLNRLEDIEQVSKIQTSIYYMFMGICVLAAMIILLSDYIIDKVKSK